MTITKSQFQRALRVIEKLMTKDPEKKSLEGQILRLLAEIIERYEISMRWGGTRLKNQRLKSIVMVSPNKKIKHVFRA